MQRCSCCMSERDDPVPVNEPLFTRADLVAAVMVSRQRSHSYLRDLEDFRAESERIVAELLGEQKGGG